MNNKSTKLSDLFKATAFVDWIEFRIQTTQFTNQQTLQTLLHNALNLPEGRNVWVEPQDKSEGGAASIFHIRIQDPNNYGQVYRAISKIEAAKGFLLQPQIIGIELGLDFYSKTGNSDSLADLLKVLAGRLYTSGNNPRQYLPINRETKALTTHGTRLDDGTYYVGNKRDPIYWKSYVKRYDIVRRDDDGIIKGEPPLLPKYHRARIEVTLQHGAPKRFGLTTLDDLEYFEFSKLAKLFKFRKPRDVSQMAKDNALMRLIRTKSRQLADATEYRGQHSFESVGKKDKWGRERMHSTHTEADNALSKTARDRLKRLTERFAKNSDEN